MPRYSYGNTALGSAMGGMSKLAAALGGAGQTEQDAYTRELGAQSKIGQALADMGLKDAQAAEAAQKAGILAGRPEVFNRNVALQAGTDVPTVKAFQYQLDTGKAPDVPMGPPTESGDMGVGSFQLSPEARTAIGNALRQNMLLQFNTGDINPEQWAKSMGEYQQQAEEAAATTPAQVAQLAAKRYAAKGSAPYHFDANGSVGNFLTGTVDQSSPLAQAHLAGVNLGNDKTRSSIANEPLIPNGQGGWMVNQPLVDSKVKIAQAGAPVTYGTPVAGVLNGETVMYQPGNRPGAGPQVLKVGDAPIRPAPAKSEGMSATLQKELVEADDLAQNSANVMTALQRALAINDQAYSGYQATNRAKVRSNMPGQSAQADATIELENLIAGQGLESLRAIFGGNPTEGERKILLDLQASTDKTPAQRKAIIERALQGAQRRQQFAKNRADAIRSGKYLSEGAAPLPPVTSPGSSESKTTDLGGGFTLKH